MISHIIEVSGSINWGKFMLLRFDREFDYRSQLSPGPLLNACGWTPDHLWVLDLQTGEGAWFRPGGSAQADLEKHAVWVCPMYEPFLTWLYGQDLSDITKLPALVQLTPEQEGQHAAIHGYRRAGPQSRAEGKTDAHGNLR